MSTRVGSHKPKTTILFFLILLAYFAWILLKPLPQVKPQSFSSEIAVQAPPSSLAWPGGQAAATLVGTDILEKNGESKPVPTASTAKIITALLILKQKPLDLGQQGPVITISDNDVAIYKNYVANDGSVLPVQVGEQISEYQALQTIMLPSANNMADSLAIWAYGSLENYSKAANQFLSSAGLNSTHVGGDASGLSPDSTSTAADLAQIGALAMQNPVLAQIVGQSTATGIPLAGTVKNVNILIGTDGIIGVKTGNSDAAGGAYVSASTATINSKPVVIVTAVVGAPSLAAAMKDTLPLVKSAQSNYTVASVIKSGQILATYKLPWGNSIQAIAKQDLSVVEWNGKTINAKASLANLKPGSHRQGHIAGHVIVNSTFSGKKSSDIILQSTPPKPSLAWRLEHPFTF